MTKNNKTRFIYVLYSDKTWGFGQSKRAGSYLYYKWKSNRQNRKQNADVTYDKRSSVGVVSGSRTITELHLLLLIGTNFRRCKRCFDRDFDVTMKFLINYVHVLNVYNQTVLNKVLKLFEPFAKIHESHYAPVLYLDEWKPQLSRSIQSDPNNTFGLHDFRNRTRTTLVARKLAPLYGFQRGRSIEPIPE